MESSSNFSSPRRGASTPRGGGRGSASYIEIPIDFNSPRGGRGSRGRGRGDHDENQFSRGGGRPHFRGRGLEGKLRHGAPLAKVLYEDRPYLKPITFVRSVYTATLFQAEEDILKPVDATIGMLNVLSKSTN